MQVKFDLERCWAMSKKAQSLSKELRQNAQEQWEKDPWLSCVTDGNGQATVTVVRMALDRNRSPTPPRDRDLRSDPYLIKVRSAQGAEELLKVLITLNEPVRGERFTITIFDIRDPVYVDRK